MSVPSNIELAKDTLSHTINCPHCGGAVVVKDSSNTFWTLFWIPLSILVLFSIAKYTIGVAVQKIPIKHMLLEIPIDINTIISALIISSFIQSGNSQLTINIGIILIMITIILSFFLCWYRQKVIKVLDSNQMKDANKEILKLLLMCCGWTVIVIVLVLQDFVWVAA